MSKINVNRAIFFGLGTFFGGFVLNLVGGLLGGRKG